MESEPKLDPIVQNEPAKKSKVEHAYDAWYSQEGYFGDVDDLVTKAARLSGKSTGMVLDIGAGQGRNALWLASQGFTVEATDISGVGVEAINKTAEEKGLSVTAIKGDAREGLKKDYDVIMLMGLLHNLTKEEGLAVIEDMQVHTNPEGLNLVSAFTKDGDFFRRTRRKGNFYLDAGELRRLFEGWEILEYTEIQTTALAVGLDGNNMRNITAQIIARKPSNESSI